RVGQGGVPADHDEAADPHLQLAEQDGVGEVAVIADHHAPLFAQGEVDALHRAVSADGQRLLQPPVTALEGELSCQDAAGADAHVRRQLTIGPAARAHGLAPPPMPAGMPNWMPCSVAYRPSRASNSSCVPSSTICPSLTTTMRSASRMVE